MPDLLLELFCEEIPARMQAKAADDLKTLVTDRLVDAGLVYEGARAFVTPRRLALVVDGVPVAQPDRKEERKGPRVGAPDKAVEGFLRGAGLSSIDEAQIVSDPKKGDFYVAVTEKKGKPAEAVIAEIVPDVIRGFPWPKSMRWGAASTSLESLRWVRPLQGIVCTFGPETEETDVIGFAVDGIEAGNQTFGHRFLAPDAITVRRFDDYEEKLRAASVMLDAEERRDAILHAAKDLALANQLTLVEDPALLAEVAGLVEWPVPLMGAFDEAFLDIPPEVIRTTIRANQKCFVLEDPARNGLANRFILVSNMIAKDGGAEIIAGNERVIRARLSDAKFFWEQDQKETLAARLPQLDGIIFHDKLGSQGDRVRRIVALAEALAPTVGADPSAAGEAARLAKADLVTGMVGEFPELQGLMGKYYALKEGLAPEIATAIEMHYKPQGPSDTVPTEPVSIAVALADKFDILTGFWAIDEKPTGSKDPYALRRAALGVIRIILDNEIRLPLLEAFKGARSEFAESPDLLEFFADRLKVHLRDEGARYDLIDAVFALPNQDDLVLITRRVTALAAFLATEDGANLLTGYKRAVNILKAEEKKDGVAYELAPEPGFFEEQAEKRLFEALGAAAGEVDAALALEDFEDAMRALSRLRAPVDRFFDEVTVNAESAAVRRNRLCLLNAIRVATLKVADFSKISG